jgi:hypothetical protein
LRRSALSCPTRPLSALKAFQTGGSSVTFPPHAAEKRALFREAGAASPQLIANVRPAGSQ